MISEHPSSSSSSSWGLFLWRLLVCISEGLLTPRPPLPLVALHAVVGCSHTKSTTVTSKDFLPEESHMVPELYFPHLRSDTGAERPAPHGLRSCAGKLTVYRQNWWSNLGGNEFRRERVFVRYIMNRENHRQILQPANQWGNRDRILNMTIGIEISKLELRR